MAALGLFFIEVFAESLDCLAGDFFLEALLVALDFAGVFFDVALELARVLPEVAGFLEADFAFGLALAVVLAAAFRAGAFLAAARLAGVFPAAAFFTGDFLGAAFLLGAFLLGAFVPEAFAFGTFDDDLAADFEAALLRDLFGGFLPDDAAMFRLWFLTCGRSPENV